MYNFFISKKETYFMKKIHGILIVSSLALSAMAGAFAFASVNRNEVKKAEAIDGIFYIGEHDMIAEPTYQIGDGTAVFDEPNKTLTLTNFNYSGEGYFCSEDDCYAALYYSYNQDLTINLVGENTIKFSSNTLEPRRVFGSRFISQTKITFQGDGVYNTESGNTNSNNATNIGLSCYYSDFVLKSGTINVKTGELKQDAGSELIGMDIYKASFIVEGGKINAIGGKSQQSSYGLRVCINDWEADNKYCSISGGTIVATAGEATNNGFGGNSYGLVFEYVKEAQPFMTGGEIIATGGKAYNDSIGIYTEYCNAPFKGGKVVATSLNEYSKSGVPARGYGITSLAWTGDISNRQIRMEQKFALEATGKTLAIGSKNSASSSAVYGFGLVINKNSGTGWTDVNRTEGETAIEPRTESLEVLYKSVKFTALEPTYTSEPTAKSDLTYTGQPQPLVNAGSSNEGTVVYRLGETGEFSTEIPTATEAGTYTVQYKILGDDTHGDSEIKSVTVTIGEAPVPGPDDPVGPVNPDDPSKPASKGLNGGAIVGIVIGSIVLLLGLAYLLLFFLFNRWVKIGEKAVRVFPFAFGKKNGKERLLAFPCKFVYKEKPEIFKTKEEALK